MCSILNTNLKIGVEGFSLPIELATGSIAILAIKGSGKSYTSAVITEELIDNGVPVTIIDPTGVHWGLKSSASGKSAGYPVTIFGGDHADMPLEEESGEILARWVVERRFCSILDLSHFRKAQIYRFLTPFLLELYRLNRAPMHLVADEADLYAPQRAFPDVARCLGAMEDIVRRGRARGIGTTLITQRPASLNKDVLTQCDCLMALRISHPRDIAPVMEWVDQHGDSVQGAKMLAGLAALPTGSAWVWAPRAEIFERIQVRRRTTFDSSATPKIGQAVIEPSVMAKIDLAQLGKEIADSMQRAKDNDPKELKQRITQLTNKVSQLEREKLQVKTEIKEVPLLQKGEIAALEAVRDDLSTAVKQLTDTLKSASPQVFKIPSHVVPQLKAIAAQPSRIVIEKQPSDELTGTQQKILDTILMLGVRGIDRNRECIARWMDIHPNGGRYGSDMAFLRAEGYIEHWDLLDKGMHSARLTETGFEAAKAVLDGTQRGILDVLKGYNGTFARDTLAECLGIHPNGGRFGSDLARLRTMGLIPERGEIRLLEVAFK